MTKKLKQKFKHLEDKKRFQGEKKSFYIIFKELSVAKNGIRPASAPINVIYLFVCTSYLLHFH